MNVRDSAGLLASFYQQALKALSTLGKHLLQTVNLCYGSMRLAHLRDQKAIGLIIS